jgi:hypothetical protein
MQLLICCLLCSCEPLRAQVAFGVCRTERLLTATTQSMCARPQSGIVI